MYLWQPGSKGARTRLFVADDDAPSRALLRAILEREGATVEEAPDGRTALERIRSDVPDLALLDVRMPGLDGIRLTRRLRDEFSDGVLPIILVTGYGDTAKKVAGLEAGATDFVTKPYEPTELIARVRAGLRTRAAFERLESMQDVLAALANAVEAKDPTTEDHCSRLADLALGLATAANVTGDALEAIGYGAILHDVGKIGVPEAVIRKTGPLTDDEWEEMRRHPLIGSRIVEPLRVGRLVAPVVRSHHERWDGRGYPDGLRGAAIPFGARVVTIVDAYDAMTHDRPYRPALSEDQAREELRACASQQFDPELIQLFLDQLHKRDAGRQPAADIGLGAAPRTSAPEPAAR